MQDSRSRKWQLTINNPLDKDLNHIALQSQLKHFKSLTYWCMSDEVGDEGTYHTHLYFVLSNATRFSTIKKRFPQAHIEMARGTSIQNREYVFKEGKWLNDHKNETNLKDTHEEYGDCPIERQGARNDLSDLYDMIKQGMSNYDILEDSPQYMLQLDKIERCRQIVKDEKFKNTFRNLDVTYVFGVTGTGKTRGVMEEHGYENVYRITDYDHPFDGYKGEDIVIFEEFRSSLKIQDMLNFLDGYPLQLPCRYNNKVACFTKVYIITNITLEQQFVSVQELFPETWKAFLRRIHHVKEYTHDGVFKQDIKDYLYKPNLIKTNNQYVFS